MIIMLKLLRIHQSFNTQPPEGGWVWPLAWPYQSDVSTHSRLKAAGGARGNRFEVIVFQHTAA